ncbi:aldo/keto reductase [Corticicoccus populi]|uniref:Aldo/keto reductase family oxidoreductase n=1 Tax=Corticicoccus populi TaxID=1812821 RepID=A0ABW5WYK3_9STAP
MKTQNVGNTEWQASSVILGNMRMDKLSVDEAAEVIETAYHNGINFFDSADIYGKGQSEIIFGQALKQSSVNREDIFIQSKAGIVPPTAENREQKRYDFSREHLLNSVDGILERMQIDYLDSFLLHRPDPLMDVAEVASVFDELEKSGKVKHFGVSNFNTEQFKLLQNNVSQKLIINQLQFSIMHSGMIDVGLHANMTDSQSVDHDGSILTFSQNEGTTIQAWSPFQYGTFDGVFIDNEKFPKLNETLEKLSLKYGVTKNAVAAAWILRHPANFQVILGTMNPKRIADSAAGADIVLDRQEWYDIYLAAGNQLP